MDHQVALTADALQTLHVHGFCFIWLLHQGMAVSSLHLYRAEIAKKLDIGRVVFLIVVMIDFAGLALAMVMRGMSDHAYR